MASVLINDSAGTVTIVNLAITGLSNGTVAHIHGPAAVGATASPICFFTSGAVVASYTNVLCQNSSGATATYSPDMLAAFRNGSMYFNARTEPKRTNCARTPNYLRPHPQLCPTLSRSHTRTHPPQLCAPRLVKPWLNPG